MLAAVILSIVLMATAATLISKLIKKYKWISWLGLLAILAVAIDLIYTDLKLTFMSICDCKISQNKEGVNSESKKFLLRQHLIGCIFIP